MKSLKSCEKQRKIKQARLSPLFKEDQKIRSNDRCVQILLFVVFYSWHNFAIFCGGKKSYSALTERIFLVILFWFVFRGPNTKIASHPPCFVLLVQGLGNRNIDFLSLSEKNVTQRFRFTKFHLEQ